MSREETHAVAVINYETVFIAEPEISTEQADQLLAKIKQTITDNKGTVTSEDRWGRRRLAYPIRGHREGFYAVLVFNAEAPVVAALEHLFNVTDSVVRHLTIRQIKHNKTFRPRRERPAGAAEGHRPGGRPSGPPRTREFVVRHATPPAASTAAPAAVTPAPAPPEGEKPS
jgi:small subunit ribosomal protein S6